jgi:magnesium transporter
MIQMYPGNDLAKAVWIDLVEPSEEEVARVSHAVGLRVPDQSEIREIESTSRLAFDNGAYYVSTPMPGADVEEGTNAVGFVLSSDVLLTIRFAKVPSFEAAHALCGTQAAKTAQDAFVHLLEMIVDRAADALERAGAECDDLSKRAFRSVSGHKRARIGSRDLGGSLRRIGTLAGQMLRIREGLLGIGRVAAYVMEGGVQGGPAMNTARLKGIRTDISSLTEYESQVSGELQFLLDATLGFINIEQNEIVKTLTIASVVGIPPVLVAGIYGMNFRFMPELGWAFGYPMALGLIIISAVIPLVWFKRRGWM